MSKLKRPTTPDAIKPVSMEDCKHVIKKFRANFPEMHALFRQLAGGAGESMLAYQAAVDLSNVLVTINERMDAIEERVARQEQRQFTIQRDGEIP